MTQKKIDSLREAGRIMKNKIQNNFWCGHTNYSPNFRINFDSKIEKGERVLRDKILSKV